MSFIGDGNTLLHVREGEIIQVDTNRWACTVAVENGVLEDVPLAPTYLNMRGNGIFHVPEIGTRVFVAQPCTIKAAKGGFKTKGKGRGANSFILCSAIPVMGKEDDNEEGVSETGNSGTIWTGDPDYRGDRPVVNEGDIVFSSSGGNFCILRSGGVLEIGASQIARRYYIPIQNVIRDITSIYDLNTAGGDLSWYTRRGELTESETEGEDPESTWGTITETVVVDPGDGTDENPPTTAEITISKTPTVFELNLKEFAQDEPLISLKMGRIEVDDPTAGLMPGALGTDILFEFNIADNFKIYIDRHGNYQKHQLGAEVTCHEVDQKAFYAGGLVQEVTGRFDQLLGGRNIQIERGDDYLKVKDGSRFVQVSKDAGRGSLYTEVGGDIGTQCNGMYSLVTGEAKHETKGSYTLDTLNYAIFDIGGDLEISAVGNINETATQSKTVLINNASASPGVQAYKLTAMVGEISLHSVLGTVEITAGSPNPIPTLGSMAPLGKVSVTPLGVTMSMALGTGGVVAVDATGVAIRMGSNEIGVGAGGIHMGIVGGVGAGGVVTTLTHPFCFVTGLPIPGSPFVGVSGPPTPVAVVVSATTSKYFEGVEVA